MVSSSSAFSSKRKTNYDVFLSFRGQETRNTFTSHLYEALRQKGIHTFLDDDKLERGKSIAAELFEAIENSRCSIIVLSRNYASSPWCLDELVKIVQCMKDHSQIVLPIFYHMEPCHVRKQTGSIWKAFRRHQQDFSHNQEKVQGWRDALTEVANLAGWHLRDRDEAKFIQDFIVEVSSKLDVAPLNISEDLVGMESRLGNLKYCMLSSSVDGVRFIGICGMGGVGKTTLAKAYYEEMSSKFEGCSFLANVREVCEKKENGLVYLQNHLVSDIIKGLPIKARDVHQGMNMIRNRLHNKKVLIVLDDVDKLAQLKALAYKDNWFGSGSRIIITTRDESLLQSTYKEFITYRVEQLDESEGLQLFSWKAFKSIHPPEEYTELSKQVIAYAKGLPLALEILGSFLCGKTTNEWKSALDRLKKHPNEEITKVLRISFDGLEESEKNIFLDIACFFYGFHKDYVIHVMDCCGFFPEIGIRVLIDKSLLHIGPNNRLWMHDLLQEMGKEIVREKSRNESGRRSRIWDYEDLCHVLEYDTGTEEVEAIVCRYLGTKKLSWKAFSNMKKLRLLIIYVVWENRFGVTNEIPTWFIHRSSGTSISIQVDPNWCNSKWRGFALSLCFVNKGETLWIDLSRNFDYWCDVIINRQEWGYGQVKLLIKGKFFVRHLWSLHLPRHICFSTEWQNNKPNQIEFSFKTIDLNDEDYPARFYGERGTHLVFDEQDIECLNRIAIES